MCDGGPRGMKKLWRALGVTLTAAAMLACGRIPAQAAEDPLYAWVQLGPGDSAQARALVPAGATCPNLVVDGQARKMQLRAPADPADAFAVTSCQAALPRGVASLQVGSLALPLPSAAPRRIAVIGDTGCRIKGDRVQACDDPAAWPFPAVAEAVAAARPDLIVHVGDYHYRESPCPEDAHGCAGSEWGYNWGTWQADFFAPAGPMLAGAPFLFVRGNHETCERAWRGWYRFLAEIAWTPECHDYSAPYAVTVDGHRLIVLDSTKANDRKAKPGQVESYAALLHAVNDLAAGAPGSWLVTHKPFWSIGKVKGAGGRHPHSDGYNAVLQAADEDTPLAAEIGSILSGHFHLFQALSFAGTPARPNQLILGTGGTLLAEGPAVLPAGFDAWGMAAKNFMTLEKFGFALLEPTGGSWRMTLNDTGGTVFATCDLAPFSARCTSVP